MNLETGKGLNRGSGTVFTVGHSSHSLEVFLGLLVEHGTTALVDVRSAPYSRFNPQFNREELAAVLKVQGIAYIYLGHELGGRSEDPSCYDRETGCIRYDLLAKEPRFRDGLLRVLRGAKDHRVTLMCAEKRPLDCHRTLLVGHELDKLGVEVAHILSDAGLQSHEAAMDELLDRFPSCGPSLLEPHRSRSEQVAAAVAEQAKVVGHRVDMGAAVRKRGRG